MGAGNGKNENKNKIPLIIIEKGIKKEQNPNQSEEAIIPVNPTYIDVQKLKIITQQKDNSICKILKNNQPIGTGFLCNASCNKKIRRALITAYHVLSEKDLIIGNEIQLSFKDNNNKNK